MRISSILLIWLASGVVQLLNCQVVLSAEKVAQKPAKSACASENSSADQKPFYAFEKAREGIDPTPGGWHREHEKHPDYAESWFLMVQTRPGDVLIATLSITNLGIRTFDGACDIRFYASNGHRYHTYAQYRRKDISGASDKMDMHIGPNHLFGQGQTYRLRIDKKDLQLDLTLKGVLPVFQFGNGRVSFFKDRSADWNIRFDAPRAVASGTLAADDKTYNLEGNGYLDHTWSTIKLPSFAKKWYSLRLYDKRFSIILHQIHLTDKFGGSRICAAIVGDNDKLLPVREFLFKPLKWRKDEASGLQIPEKLALDIKTTEYAIKGTITEARFLDSVDVLGQLSWSVRTAIKAFYAEPYLIRYQAQSDIHLTDNTGISHSISGPGVVGINHY